MAELRTAFQEQVAALRRTQILDAAMAVFAERGYHRATIREVARTAGVADGTIYNYFADKEALLLACLDRLNQTEQRAAQFAPALRGHQRFRQKADADYRPAIIGDLE